MYSFYLIFYACVIFHLPVCIIGVGSSSTLTLFLTGGLAGVTFLGGLGTLNKVGTAFHTSLFLAKGPKNCDSSK